VSPSQSAQNISVNDVSPSDDERVPTNAAVRTSPSPAYPCPRAMALEASRNGAVGKPVDRSTSSKFMVKAVRPSCSIHLRTAREARTVALWKLSSSPARSKRAASAASSASTEASSAEGTSLRSWAKSAGTTVIPISRRSTSCGTWKSPIPLNGLPRMPTRAERIADAIRATLAQAATRLRTSDFCQCPASMWNGLPLRMRMLQRSCTP